jgi:hypothetical protein
MIAELFPHITLKTLHGDSELSRTSAPWAIGARTRIQAGLFSHITAKINQ